jgi:hypothetical protein
MGNIVDFTIVLEKDNKYKIFRYLNQKLNLKIIEK